jgi:hypothetical protein
MKTKILFSSLLMLIAFLTYGQEKAQSVEKADNARVFFVEAKPTRTCGTYNDFSYSVTNNTQNKVDIKLFVEGLDKKWRSLGYVNNLETGAKTNPSNFLSCANTGNWVIYYRTAGTRDEFPLPDEVQKKYGR